MKTSLTDGQIIIYQDKLKQHKVNVLLQKETVWLRVEQIGELFQKDRSTIQRHIKNIVNSGELTLRATCAKNAQVQKEGVRNILRNIPYYNLDMIIAVGYRVNSKRATQFRIWATDILKQYLTQGFALNKHILQSQQSKITYLQQAIELMSRANLENKNQITAAIDVLKQFSAGLSLLDDYDNQTLDDHGYSVRKAAVISPSEFLELIQEMKPSFASDVFGNPKDKSFESSVRQIYQTFGKKELYPSIEQKAAMLLYLIVKNHSFSDGNKRIAAACFLYFLDKNNLLYRKFGKPIVDNKALAALTLLIAISKPNEKDTLLKVIISMLNR